MSAEDDLNRLREALKARAPAPRAAARDEAMARAMKSFDSLQASQERLRSNQDHAKGAGLWKGVQAMFNRLSSKAALGAGASVMALGLGAVLVIQQSPNLNAPLQPASQDMAPATIEAPADAAMTGAAASSRPPMAPVAAEAPMAKMEHGIGAGAVARMPVANGPAGISPMPMGDAMMQRAPLKGDSFANFPANPLRITAEAPVSTFSIDVDTASWSWARASLRMGQMPDPASVRVEEMVNYFPYAYPAPTGDQPFSTSVAVFDSPWAKGKQIVRIGLQGALPEARARAPLNLVFLIDTSGSMMGDDRLGLLKSSFKMLLDTLRPEDKVAIVAYAGSAGEVLAPTAASDRAAILRALEGLEAGGSTAGGEGLRLAYDLAAKMKGEGSVDRVILATDGDFNVGASSPEELKAQVTQHRKSGTYLSVLGFGRGNLDDALMQSLAQNGNGQAAYIDSASEARKVLVEQASGALFPIANDVKIQVEWNPTQVAEYRLIGYETRALAREDFANDKVDAGEIGAGHQVTALYEITPTGSPARLTEDLRYGQQVVTPASDEAGWLRLRYKRPGETESQLIEAPIPASSTAPDQDALFATAIAGFGQLLAGGSYMGDWTFTDAAALAASAKGPDPYGYRTEAIGLMQVAASLGK